MDENNLKFKSPRLFNTLSWTITAVLVVSMLGFGYHRYSTIQEPSQTSILPTSTVNSSELPIELPLVQNIQKENDSITKLISFRTNIPERPRYVEIDHEVEKGESIFGISSNYEITPETLLWANYDELKDSPDSIRVGMVLRVPPTNGVYYQWQEGDTIASVADKYNAKVEDIINWPGNDIDLLDPEPEVGSFIMIPGGEREFVQWLIPTIARGSSGTAALNGSACGAGPVGSGGFVWPADNHFLSGNDYWSGHLGIDIAAGEGAAVYAADSGVVTMADGGYNGGYGNVVMIDHGNGYVTLYGHLSQINVVRCQGVYAGSVIALAGNTGNSFGSHLHFEVRQGGGFINPWYVLP
ncbi:MAG TPA: M23 family metallopeptidase [Anaerolineales bacterium]|nr:M23 family metallopeptidase [Anaerolineales bacterium]